MGKRFAILIGVAATGVMALGAQTGAATEVVEYDTKLGITHEGHHGPRGVLWHGAVWSGVSECEPGREVILFRKQPGPDRKLGADLSGLDHGWFSWGIVAPSFGHVYAKVTPKVGDGFVCRADYAYESLASIFIKTAGSSAFKGMIESNRKFCRNKRLVVIKRDTPAKDPIIARDRTGNRGKPRYLADAGNPVTGAFYARATRKIRIVSGNRIVCRPLQSAVIHVD